jgi:DNA-binding transcriptional MerR regulator
MGSIRTNAAAAMLGVSPNTLRSWERRFGFPEPRRTAGGHRLFDFGEIEALRAALEETHNISSAVALARERGVGPASASRLRSALARFDEAGADRVLEESLAVRSVERTVEDVLLSGVCALDGDGDGASAEYGFAWRWATGWLAAAMRVAPPATRPEGIVVFDASAPCDLDALHAQALELCLRRRGLRTLSLTVAVDATRLGHALHALAPRAVVLTGQRATLDAMGRLVYAARRTGGDTVAIYDYRGALPTTGATTVPRLGDAPTAAAERLAAELEGAVAPVQRALVVVRASRRLSRGRRSILRSSRSTRSTASATWLTRRSTPSLRSRSARALETASRSIRTSRPKRPRSALSSSSWARRSDATSPAWRSRDTHSSTCVARSSARAASVFAFAARMRRTVGTRNATPHASPRR